MIPRLRESETDFVSAIDSAATRLGLAPIFVEKDYWVTQVLRILHEQYPGAFVFKGGTSLSKGYGLIDRFSEDVDILVQSAKGDSAKTRAARLRAMTEGVAAELGVDYAASAAFAPPAGSELREWLEQRYQDAADLLPAATTGRWPSFGQVLQRIDQHAKLL